MVQCKSSSHGTALYGKGMQHNTLRCLSCSLLFHRYFAAWREMLNANHWIDTNVKCVLSPSLAAKLLPKLEGKPVHGLPRKIRFWQQCFVHGLCISIRHNTFTGSQWLATCVFFRWMLRFAQRNEIINFTLLTLHSSSSVTTCKQVAVLTSPSRSAAPSGSGLAYVQAVEEASESQQGLQEIRSTPHRGNHLRNLWARLVAVHSALAGWLGRFSPSQWKRWIRTNWSSLCCDRHPSALWRSKFLRLPSLRSSTSTYRQISGSAHLQSICPVASTAILQRIRQSCPCCKFQNILEHTVNWLSLNILNKIAWASYCRSDFWPLQVSDTPNLLTKILALRICSCVSDLSFGLTKLLGTLRSLPPCMYETS